MCVKVIPSQIWDAFWDTVYINFAGSSPINPENFKWIHRSEDTLQWAEIILKVHKIKHEPVIVKFILDE